MKPFYNNFTLGVLGGGQLGRMLNRSCVNFNVKTKIIDPSPFAPCKGVATEFVLGDIKDEETVYQFGKTVDLLTIEIENVNINALKRLQKEGTKVFPQPEVIEIIQDKRVQKQFYKEHNIPTADFILTENKADVVKNSHFLPAFHKLGKGGYDGGGVVKIASIVDKERAFDAPGLLEKLVDFEKEISVIVARNESGEVKAFPSVEMVFHPEHNLVDYLLSPAQVSEAIKQEAEKIAVKVAEAFDIVGILAVEMFLTKDGKILVNEVAPRPHNSGHQTINANYISQFEQHLRAILNLPLGATNIKTPSAMVNLLGEEGYEGEAIYNGIEEVLAVEGVNLFLYGKPITKPHRKMGHITVIDEKIDKLIEKVDFVKKTIKIVA